MPSIRRLSPVNQAVSVQFQYPVHFTKGLFDKRNQLLLQVVNELTGGETGKVLCVIERSVARCHPKLFGAISEYTAHFGQMSPSGKPLVFAGGEQCKNSRELLEAVCQAIDQFSICRHSYVLAVGGGAFLDAVGFAAAISHRGVRLIRVPTTVLSQDDSGMGVKNGINAFGKKNFLGSFAPPAAVLVDFDFLSTLPLREVRSGLAEAVKIAVLKDARFFSFLENHAYRLARGSMKELKESIYRCARFHLEHIAQSADPFEYKSSRPLDFGHWAAHKLEQLSKFRLRHGEAVALGIVLDATYAYKTGMLPEKDLLRIYGLLRELGLALFHPLMLKKDQAAPHGLAILLGIEEFREHLGGELTVMLLKRVGQGLEVNRIDYPLMIQSIKQLQMYANSHH